MPKMCKRSSIYATSSKVQTEMKSDADVLKGNISEDININPIRDRCRPRGDGVLQWIQTPWLFCTPWII